MADLNQPANAWADCTNEANGIPVIRLRGELDISNIAAIEAELDPVLAQADHGAVFDLSALAFMDSSGIALLLRARERVGDVVVRNPSPVVHRILQATGLIDTLRIES